MKTLKLDMKTHNWKLWIFQGLILIREIKLSDVNIFEDILPG